MPMAFKHWRSSSLVNNSGKMKITKPDSQKCSAMHVSEEIMKIVWKVFLAERQTRPLFFFSLTVFAWVTNCLEINCLEINRVGCDSFLLHFHWNGKFLKQHFGSDTCQFDLLSVITSSSKNTAMSPYSLSSSCCKVTEALWWILDWLRCFCHVLSLVAPQRRVLTLKLCGIVGCNWTFDPGIKRLHQNKLAFQI